MTPLCQALTPMRRRRRFDKRDFVYNKKRDEYAAGASAIIPLPSRARMTYVELSPLPNVRSEALHAKRLPRSSLEHEEVIERMQND